MKYLHTMVRVHDLDASLAFYCDLLGLVETKRHVDEKNQFTLMFLAAPNDIAQVEVEQAPLLELTYNWDGEVYQGGRNFGHLAFAVDDIYALCQKMLDNNVTINVPPKDGHMAFVRSPDNISIELLQKGDALPVCEPWKSMSVIGEW
ncbi:MAG: lactoylglutathione lyase [Polaribacter sp.]|jgi:lactoylglutathione lyase